MTLLSLGEPGRVGSALDGIRLDAPFFAVTAIPEHAYGRQPAAPVGTISVRALLVVRADLDDDLVHAITDRCSPTRSSCRRRSACSHTSARASTSPSRPTRCIPAPTTTTAATTRRSSSAT